MQSSPQAFLPALQCGAECEPPLWPDWLLALDEDDAAPAGVETEAAHPLAAGEDS